MFHTNEGHAGYLGLERIRELHDRDGLSFDEALAAVRAGTVFTTHTPVPAGIDRFPIDMVRHYFSAPAATPSGDSGCCPASRWTGSSRSAPRTTPTCSTWRTWACGWPSAPTGCPGCTARSPGACSAALWQGFDADEVPIGSVTNGVHGPTWEAARGHRADRGAGRRTPDPTGVGRRAVGAARRAAHPAGRRGRGAGCGRRGCSAARPPRSWAGPSTVFDPEVLTVGFARRVPTYKRLTLMLRDKDRLRDLLLDPHRPVQLVVAGKSHPADDGGKALIQEIVRFADDPAVRHRIVFLPDYDMSMARYLYWGCDVWLNNPLRPLEACGTSGMKSALNGGLNLSIRDGWWDELYDGANGWAIPTADGIEDPVRRDDLEANALYELLATQVGPAFYERTDGVPTRWVELVRHTLTTLRPAGAGHPDGRASTSRTGTRRPPAPPQRAGADGFAAGPRAGRLPGPAERGLAAGAGDRRGRLRAAGHARGRRGDDRAGRGAAGRAAPGGRDGGGGGRAGRRDRRPGRHGDRGDGARRARRTATGTGSSRWSSCRTPG